jgi:hypothetical protein
MTGSTRTQHHIRIWSTTPAHNVSCVWPDPNLETLVYFGVASVQIIPGHHDPPAPKHDRLKEKGENPVTGS